MHHQQTKQSDTVLTARSLLWLITLFIPTLATAVENSHSSTLNAAQSSIHFIALPYLNGFHYDVNNQPVMLSSNKNQQAMANHDWDISITPLTDFKNKRDKLQTIDSDQFTGCRLATDHRSIIIPIPEQVALLPPLHGTTSATTPLWLQFIKTGNLKWHSPSLTPMVIAEILAEKKRAAKLSKRMADRAFYFGYDTNDDALE